jgi:hypothetical protein
MLRIRHLGTSDASPKFLKEEIYDNHNIVAYERRRETQMSSRLRIITTHAQIVTNDREIAISATKLETCFT